MKKIAGLAAVTVALMLSAPASAAVYTLTFDEDVSVDGYGDERGADVSFATTDLDGNVIDTVFNWSGGYGDLVNVIYAGYDGDDYRGQISFAAQSGYEVRLLGLDFRCYRDSSSCQAIPYTVSAIGGKSLVAGDASSPEGGHATANFDFDFSQTGHVLNWGPDAYNGGVDNVRFEVRAISVAAVPEPATWAMMVGGMGLAGSALRRRRKVRTTVLFA